jgi:molybdopterin-containing oxidoreductase family iron-sulfur binding subunit
MTRYAMALDTFTCIGCLGCTVACKLEQGTPSGMWLAPVVESEMGGFPSTRRIYLPLLCNHCDDAPCIEACPTSAISRRSDGIVSIDQGSCCGSRACIVACPYGAIHYYERNGTLATPFEKAKTAIHQPGTAQKCSFCVERLDRGLQPACVEACPTGARVFGDRDDPESPVAKALQEREAVPMSAPTETEPSVMYLVEGVRRAGGTPADVSLPAKRRQLWGFAHAVEFWLLGAGAGLLAASRALAPDAEMLSMDAGALLALLLVAAGGLVLLSDLGRPFRAVRAFANWRSNWVSRGAIADVVFLLSALIVALSTTTVLRVTFGALAIVSGLVVAVYPSFVMAALRAIPPWRGPRLTAAFTADALLMGVALCGLLADWDRAVLASLLAVALIRAAVALPWGKWRTSGHALAGALITAALVVVGLVSPAAAASIGPAALVVALWTGLVGKAAALRWGTFPTPFDHDGRTAA